MVISICGWCPGAKEDTARLVAQGHKVSHGCCSRCLEQILESLDVNKETKQ